MTTERTTSEFPDHADENRRIWDANAHWWDDMPEIPPVMVVRMKLEKGSQPSAARGACRTSVVRTRIDADGPL